MLSHLSGKTWLNGEIMQSKDAKIPLLSHGLHYASSVYEGIRSYSGKIFEAKWHYERMLRSADMIDMRIGYSVEQLVSATQSLIDEAKEKHCYIRAISWHGSSVISVSSNNADTNTAISVWPRSSIADTGRRPSIKMNIAKWKRPHPDTMPVHSKTAAMYITSSMNKKYAELEGFDDALTLDYRNCIAEATSSNIFFVRNNTVITPKPISFLNGITRQIVLSILRDRSISCEERDIELDELGTFSECFLTGTAVEILPVALIQQGNQQIKFNDGAVTNDIIIDYIARINTI